MKKLYFLFFILIFLIGCTPAKKNSEQEQLLNSLNVKYAKGFKINYFKNYKELIVFSPWNKGKVYAKYYLVKDKNIKTPSDGTKILVPFTKIAATSVTQFAFLNQLHEINTIDGVCSPKIIYNQEINKRIAEGKIVNLGDAFQINVEKTLELNPNAVIMSGYNQNDPYAKRVEKAGVPVIFDNEWMEQTLLARAEWIKYIAAFYNKEKQADSVFTAISNKYNKIKELAQHAKYKPVVMSGSNFRGTWYVPSGRSFMSNLYADAGANYCFASDTTKGSIPLNLETALKYFANADFWLDCNSKSISDLLKTDSKYALFRPVKLKQVYNFNKRLLPGSANDFWESAVARPDLLLSDVIAILHPELMPGYELKYASKLK